MSEKVEVKINVVGWLCVFENDEPVAVVKGQRQAEFVAYHLSELNNVDEYDYQIQPITAKVDFGNKDVTRILQGLIRGQHVDSDYAREVLEKIQ